jgi:hypothetical protein
MLMFSMKGLINGVNGANVMDFATKENQDWTEWLIYMDLWMKTRMEIWIVGDLQASMCLTCLEEQ